MSPGPLLRSVCCKFSEHYLSVLVYMHPMMFTSMFLSPLVSWCLNIPLSMFQYKVDFIFFRVLDNLPKNGPSASCLKYWMHDIHLVGAKSVSSHDENNFNFLASLHVYQSANTWYRIHVFKVSNLWTLGTEFMFSRYWIFEHKEFMFSRYWICEHLVPNSSVHIICCLSPVGAGLVVLLSLS
jgi:hypothetical protein